MNKALKIYLLFCCTIAIIAACSTEKNTAISRGFNGLNARYNGLFNANELLRLSMLSYRSNIDEDYYNIVPVDPVPSETEVEAYYTPIDTAISKCRKVITDHSMPSNDRPAKKNAEHNNWIDENWTTIGIASYYRRDYDDAMRSFKFIRKFFDDDPALYVGELWMAKTNIKLGKLTEAKFNLDNLDKALLEQESGETKKKDQEKSGKTKSKAAKLNKTGSNTKDVKKTAKFPKKILFDFEKTKAELALANNDKLKAIEFLEASLKHAKGNMEKGRVHFVLGQLYESQGNNAMAVKRYRKARKYNIPFKMSFTARIKAAMLAGGPKVKKELKKMARDAKNAEFKDQIYYTLAEIELREGNEPEAVNYLTQSAFYSTTNTRQKGMAYEKLGDLRFAKRDYVKAQKYYDSCAVVVNDQYPNVEGIRNKAEKLANLVVAVETAQYEDSVQRIARMDPDDQEKFIKGVIKKIKDDEQRKKEQEAEKLRQLQQNENVFAQTSGSASKSYWNNAKSRGEGYDEFIKRWGQRENADDWRRSKKIVIASMKESEIDSTDVVDSTKVVKEPEDKLTVEYLSSKLPKTDEDFESSNARLLAALYDAGIIYKDQLNEPVLAKKQFSDVLQRKVESDFNLMSAFQLYKMQETSDPTAAAEQKSYILNNYPNSDYANYLRDPDYFIKKKERDALAEKEYVTVLDRYSRGLYAPVQAKAEQVIAEEKDNEYRPKYFLLQALCLGQNNTDKTVLLPGLNQLIAEYPDTPEAARAKEMMDVIKNGYSKNEEYDFNKKSIYSYDEKAGQLVIIFLGPKDNVDISKNKVSDFNREFFPQGKIKVSSKIYGDNQSVILLQDFASEKAAKEYVRKYKTTRKYLLDLQNAQIIIITAKNMKTLFETKELKQYENFFDEYY